MIWGVFQIEGAPWYNIARTNGKEKVSFFMENKENIQHLQKVANMLLCKVESRLQDTEPAALPPQSAKHISATLKDIRDIQLLKSGEETQVICVKLEKELEELSN